MITIPSKRYKSSITLAKALSRLPKLAIRDICDALELEYYMSDSKQEMAERTAEELLYYAVDLLPQLSKTELQLIDEFVSAGPDEYVTRKARKREFKLQKYGLVLTYVDEAAGEWHMLMPDEVRDAFCDDYEEYLDCAEQGIKPPKRSRFMEDLKEFLARRKGGSDQSATEAADSEALKKRLADFVKYVDIIETYPLNEQVLIYILLELVNAEFQHLLPISELPKYGSHIRRVMDAVVVDAEKTELEHAISAVAGDLRTTLGGISSLYAEYANGNVAEDTFVHRKLLYANLIQILQEILADVVERTPQSVLAILADHTTAKGEPIFRSATDIALRLFDHTGHPLLQDLDLTDDNH